MSGGHYNYAHHTFDELCFQLKCEIKDNFIEEDYREENYDLLSNVAAEHRNLVIQQIKRLYKDLMRCSRRVKSLEWFMSGDTGYDDFLKSMGIKIRGPYG